MVGTDKAKRRKEKKLMHRIAKSNKFGIKLDAAFNQVKNCMKTFNSIYIVTHDDPNSRIPQEIQDKWRPSRFVFGKIKILSRALEAACDNPLWMPEIQQLKRNVCAPGILLFTNLSKKVVLKSLSEEYMDTYGGTGIIATRDYVLTKGPHREISLQAEENLREMWSVPTTIIEGVVNVTQDYEVCKIGYPLTRPQFRILKLLKVTLPGKSLKALGCWTKNGKFELCFDRPNDQEENLSDQDVECSSMKKMKEDQDQQINHVSEAVHACEAQESTLSEDSFNFVDDYIDDVK